MEKKKIKEDGIKIKEIAVFGLTYEENIRNVAVALAKSGYFVKINRKDEFWEIRVYSDRWFFNKGEVVG